MRKVEFQYRNSSFRKFCCPNATSLCLYKFLLYHFTRFSNVKWNILALFNYANKQVSFFVFFQIFDVDTYSLPPVHITYCMFLVLLLHFFKFPAPARSEKKSSNLCVWIKTRNPAIFARFTKWMKIRQNEMGSKVGIFWEGHKILKNLPLNIWRYWVASKGYLPNLLVTALCHQILVFWARDPKFWLQLRFFKPVKSVGSDFT